MVVKSAVISEDGKYRYLLSRESEVFDKVQGTILWVMLNPSTADATIDDPTIRKIWKYSQRWGFHKMLVCNTNPIRSTNPKFALLTDALVNAENKKHMLAAAKEAAIIVCAWGMNVMRPLEKIALDVLKDKDLYVLELSKNGTPKHPLYLKGDLTATLWKKGMKQ